MAGACTGPGPCDTHPLGHGHNWVTKTAPVKGLGPYIRAISHALMRHGHSESDAIRLAVGIVKRWAHGGGKVTAPTRSRARKALAHWDDIKARSHDHAEEAHMTINLAGRESVAQRTMPDVAAVVRLARKVEAWPDGSRKDSMKALIARRAKALGMHPDHDHDFDYEECRTVEEAVERAKRDDHAATFTLPRSVALRVLELARPDAAEMRRLVKEGRAMKGADYYIRNRTDLGHAIRAVGRGHEHSHAAIRRYIMRRARELHATDMIPKDWASDGSLKSEHTLRRRFADFAWGRS